MTYNAAPHLMIASPSHPRLAKLSVASLALTLIVIVWGAYVRASGSGAGCGSHWPKCNGEVIPLQPSIKTIIEFTHRAQTGILGIAIVLLVLGVFRVSGRGSFARKAVTASVILLISESLIGAALVIFELVAHDASMKRVLSMSLHLTNTLLLLAAIAATTWSLFDQPAPAGNRKISVGLVTIVVSFVAIGTTGAIAALGDTLYPAASLSAGMAQEMSKTASLILKLRPLHPLVAVVGSAVIVTSVRLIARFANHHETKRWAILAQGATIAQLVLGIVNLVSLAPTWLQLTHLAMAETTWLLLVGFGLSALRPGGVRANPPGWAASTDAPPPTSAR